MQEDLPTSSGIDLMTWLNFEAAITRNPRVAQSLRDSATEIGHLRTQLKAAGVHNYNELTSALRDMTRTAEVVLTTPHLQVPFSTTRRGLDAGLYISEVALGLQPLATIARPFLGQEHVKHAVGVVICIEHQLNQPSGVGHHGCLAKLRRVHLTQTLEPLYVGLCT